MSILKALLSLALVSLTTASIVPNKIKQTGKPSWGYGVSRTGVHGVDDWGKVSVQCAGSNQSPIDINPPITPTTVSCKKLTIESDNALGLVTGVFINTGYTAQFTVNEKEGAVFLSGGPADSHNYRLSSIQFHFGCVDGEGSEHTLSSKPRSAEMHMIFYNSKYKNVREAVSQPDGLIIIASLFDYYGGYTYYVNPTLERLVSFLPNITIPGSYVNLDYDDRIELTKLVPELTRPYPYYYTYKGSLTTPPCYESVNWIILNTHLTISIQQKTNMIMLWPVMVLVFGFFRLASAAGSWGYGRTHGEVYGPSDWGHVSKYCNGRSQSPVNIVCANVQYGSDLGPLRVRYQSFLGFVKGTLVNNGHSPTFNVEKGGASLVNPVNGQKYILAQFHFHFGCTDNVGSEHTIDGKSYPGELHLVFYNSKYGNIGTAATKSDGLAVIGAFMRKSFYGASVNAGLIKSLKTITAEGAKTSGVYVRLGHLVRGLSSGRRSYYTYKGSLTTPGCYESVRWLVLRTPISVNQATLNTFRALQATHGFHHGKMCNNYRPTLPLNGRDIYLHE